MPPIFLSYKQSIDRFLIQYLTLKEKEVFQVNQWSTDVLKRLKEFVVQGKSIRGSLVLFSSQMYGKHQTKELLRMAAAVELIHSGFLIHDDLMDQDRTRRGKPAMYVQYETVGKQLNSTNPSEFGQNVALTVGDAAFFLGMNLLGTQKTNYSIEYVRVCLAQIQDVVFGFTSKIPMQEDVRSLYLYKTARYTFVLPFFLGATYAGTKQREKRLLESLGIILGQIFQMTDDLLNLFGEGKITGKTVGSDLREGKKTLALVYLLTHAGNADRQILNRIFRQKRRTDPDVTTLYRLLDKYQIKAVIEQQIVLLEQDAKRIIHRLAVSPANKESLLFLLRYLVTRTA